MDTVRGFWVPMLPAQEARNAWRSHRLGDRPPGVKCRLDPAGALSWSPPRGKATPVLRPRLSKTRLATALALLALLAGSVRAAEEPAPGALRVGTSGDYPPFSAAREGTPPFEGFDVDLARAYAADRGVELEWVRFRWPDLLKELAAERFDVAMSGVTVRPERSAAGRFTLPVLESGAIVLASAPERWSSLARLNRPVARVGVNAGGHLERVARAQLPRATLIAIPDNAEVRRAYEEGRVDAVITDTIEVRQWRGEEGSYAEFGPLTRDRKALLVRADRPELAADLDEWLLERERDGTLARLRREHFGGGAPTAEPLSALLAAVDERLSLMPLVAFVKRESGVPLEVPEREVFVLDAATEAVLALAARRETPPPSVLSVRAFFRAQIEAAKEIQRRAVEDATFRPEAPLPDLDATLRPALLRIGERIARLLLVVPAGLTGPGVYDDARDALRAPHLTDASRRALADAIAALSPASR
jgi:cyclohexadienyl dehydratase